MHWQHHNLFKTSCGYTVCGISCGSTQDVQRFFRVFHSLNSGFECPLLFTVLFWSTISVTVFGKEGGGHNSLKSNEEAQCPFWEAKVDRDRDFRALDVREE